MFLQYRFLFLIAFLSVTTFAGCETHDRTLYRYKPEPVRVENVQLRTAAPGEQPAATTADPLAPPQEVILPQ